ncbi:MAG: alpha/beta hydrolase domain-containing protein [Planctomycetota bacterium]
MNFLFDLPQPRCLICRWHLFALLLLFFPAPLWAEVQRVEIRSREPYAAGREFGPHGAYELLRGKVYFVTDPRRPANRIITDLDLASTNVKGQIESSADFEILQPTDPRRGRGTLLYEVNNRGNKLALGQFNSGADEFLLRQGFTIAWSGWIAETQPGGGRLRATLPIAQVNEQPVTGLVRAEVIVDSTAERASLAQWANQGSYEPVAAELANAQLTVREREADQRVVVPREEWHLESRRVGTEEEQGQLPHIDLVIPKGLVPGKIYELVYVAQGSIVQGLGLSGIRDFIDFLKHDASERNPLAVVDAIGNRRSTIRRAIGFGVSQSGRCLRALLADGFNADENGRIVFDGLIPHVAGAGQGFFNHRFASPTRHNAQHDNHLFPADYFPFAYGEERDPFTGRIDSLLRLARKSNTMPKIMHTQSSSEYWHRSGSLVHTDPLGERDSVVPENVRIYCFGGTQHGPGSGIPGDKPTNGTLISNPADYRPFMRSLLLALDRWIVDGQAPPPSVYPLINNRTLVDFPAAKSGWRAIPGVEYPTVIQQPEWLDRGADFELTRVATIEPPQRRGAYRVRVPAYEPDNQEMGTLQLPCVAVPVGTYTSWNLRHPSIGAPHELLSLAGGYIPLPLTTAERSAKNDPRPAVTERYRDFTEYLQRYQRHADNLVESGYLLPEDLPQLRSFAERNRELFR